MSKKIQILVSTGRPETTTIHAVIPGSGAKGKPTLVKAIQDARYQLEDMAQQGVGPQNIRIRRVGKNLHVLFDENRTADLIIVGYYDEEALDDENRGLYGRADDGRLYEYIPEDPDAAGMTANLADSGLPVSQVLGGGYVPEELLLSSVLAVSSGLSSLWAGGAAVVGAAALVQASSDSTSGESDQDKTAPEGGEGGESGAGSGGGSGAESGDRSVDPVVDPYQTGALAPESDSGIKGDNLTNVTNPVIKGKVTPGASVEVVIKNANGNVEPGGPYTTTADADGNYSLTVGPAGGLPDGRYTMEVVVEQGGNSSTLPGTPFEVDSTAPTTTAAVTGLSDNVGVVQGPVASGDTTDDASPTLSGTLSAPLEAGETIRIFDGNTYLGNATVGPNNTWVFTDTRADLSNGASVSYTARVVDAADNAGAAGTAYTATIDTSVPTISINSVSGDSVDAAVNGVFDAIERGSQANTVVTKPVISGTSTFAVGQTVSVTLTIQGVDTTKTTTVAGDGTWSVMLTDAEATQLNHGNTYAIQASVRNAAGAIATDNGHGVLVNTARPDIPTVNNIQSGTTTPVLSGVAQKEDPSNPGQFIALQAGDVITVTLNGVTSTGTIGNLPAGMSYNASTKVWTLVTDASFNLVDGSTHDVDVDVTSGISQANPSGVTKSDVGTDELVINTAVPIIALNTISGGFINRSEKESDLVITGTTDAQVGSLVTITGLDGTARTTQVVVGSGGSNVFALTIAGADVKSFTATDGSKTVQAAVVNAFGLTGTDTEVLVIDTTAPSNTTVSLDAVSGDGLITSSELDASVRLTGKVSGEFRTGDMVTVTVNGKSLSAPVQSDGSFSLNVPGSDLGSDPDKKLDVSVVATDAAGNSATFSSEKTYTIDPNLNADKTALVVNPLNGDNIVLDTATGNLMVSGKVTGAFTAGDVVTLSVNNKNLTGTVGADGVFSIGVPAADLKADADTQIEARIVVNTPEGVRTATALQDYVVQTSANNGQITALQLDTVTPDNIINAAENTGNIAITGKATGAFAAGDVVSLRVNGSTITGTLAANGTFSIDVPALALVADKDTQVEASVTGTGGTLASAAQNYAVDVRVPNGGTAPTVEITTDADNNGFVNAAELGSSSTFSVRAQFDPVQVALGDQVVFSDGTTVKTVTIVQADLTAGFVAVTYPKPAEGGSLSVSAHMQDAAGNVSATSAIDSATLDTGVPTTTVTITGISLDSGVSDSDFITNDNDGLTLSATLTAALASDERLFYSRDDGLTWSDISSSVSGTAVSHVDSGLTTTTTVRMRVQDTAANASAADSQLITIDASGSTDGDGVNDPNASASVTITSISTDTGVSSSDFITSDTSLVYGGSVSGFTANGAVVALVLTDASGAEVASTFVTPATNGSWTWDNTGVTRASGNYTLSATIVDAAGNRTNPAAAGTDSQVVTVDTSGTQNTDNSNGSATPAADPNSSATVSIEAISSDTGTSDTDFITNDNTLTYSGTVTNFTANGAAVHLVLSNASGAEVGNAFVTPDANGEWAWNDTGVTRSSGNYTLTATVVDAAGNRTNAASGGTDNQVVTVDTSASQNTDNSNGSATPQADPNTSASVEITSMTQDSGVSGTDFVTQDQTLSYSGTVNNFTANGAAVELVLTNASGLEVGRQYVTPQAGTWTWDDTGVTRDSGNYTLTATIVDAAGNRVNTSASGVDSQLIKIDATSTQNIPDGTGAAVDDANTSASIAITTLVDGPLNSSDTGVSASDFITQDRTLAIKGTVSSFVGSGHSAGAQVHVQIVRADNTVLHQGFVTPDGAGAWVFNNTSNSLADGVYTIKASIVDVAGNIVKAATDKTLVIDNSAADNPGNETAGNDDDPNAAVGVTVAVTSIHDGNNATTSVTGSKDNGTSATDFVTNDNTLVITGTTSNFSSTGVANGDRVRVQLLDAAGTTLQEQAYVLPDGNGDWAWDRSATVLADGKYTLKADIVDLAGNVVKAGNSQALVIDTSASSNPNNGDGLAGVDSNATSALTLVISSIHDTANGSLDSGSSSTDFITNDTTLIIQGTAVGFSNTGAQAGDELRIRLVQADGMVVRSSFVTVNGSGQWSLDNKANALAAGTYTIEADVVDLAGNIVKSTTQALTIDTTNTQAVTALFINKDTVSDANDSNTDWTLYSDGVSKGQTIFGTLGTGESLSKSELSLDGGTTWIEGELIGERTKFYLGDALTTGTKTLQFRTTDLAGNVSNVTTQDLVVQALPTTSSADVSVASSGSTVTVPTTSQDQALVGTSGNEVFVLDADAIAQYLVNAEPGEQWIHASGGVDTLRVNGAATTLNLNDFTDAYTNTKLQGFEIIDLESDTGSQTLVGNAAAFASMATAGWLTNANSTGKYQLVVRGNMGDKLILSGGDAYDTSGWVMGSLTVPFETDPNNSDAAVSDGRTYTRWFNESLDIDLLVDNDIVTSNKYVNFSNITTDTGNSSRDLITTDTTLAFGGEVTGLAAGEVVKVTVINSSNTVILNNVSASVNNTAWTLDNQANALALGSYTVRTSIVSSSGVTVSTGQDRVVHVVPANDAPVNNGLVNLTTDEDTALAITGLSVTDASNNGDSYTVNLTVTNGVLNVSGGTATITGSGSNSVTLTGTRSAINATLAATVSYAPTAHFNGTANLAMTTSDGSLGDFKVDSDTVNITVTSINDAPVVNTSAQARLYTENAAGVVANDTLTLSDVDSANLTAATVQITSGLTSGDVLSFNNANGISGAYNASTGTLSLSGNATLAQYQAALQSVTFSSSSDTPTSSSATRTLSWQVNDGQSANNLSNVGTSTINLTAVNDQPSTSLSEIYRGLEDAGAPINGTTTGTLVSSLTVGADADNANVGIAIVGPLATTWGTAYYSLDGGANWLNLTTACTNCSMSNAFLLDGQARLWFAGTSNTSGSLAAPNIRLWDGTDGGTSGTLKDITGLDGASGAYSASNSTLTFSIDNINDAPTLTATALGGDLETGTGRSIQAFSGASVGRGPLDPSDQTIQGLTFTVSGLQDGLDEKITVDGSTFSLTSGTSGTTSTNAMAYAVSVSGNTATVTLTKSAGVSVANVGTLVNGLAYSNTDSTPTLGNRVVTITSLKDSGGTANGGVDTTSLNLSSTISVIVDTTPPTTTVEITGISQDNGSSGSDFLTSDNNGLTIFATLSAALVAGEKLFYSLDGTSWSDITSSVTGTSVSHVDNSLTTTQTVRMRVSDASNNHGVVESQLVTIDATAPTVTVTMADTALTLAETSLVTFQFSENVANFTAADVSILNSSGGAGTGSLSNFTKVNDSRWTATYTPAANSVSSNNVIRVLANSYNDVAGNNGATGQATFNVDTRVSTATSTGFVGTSSAGNMSNNGVPTTIRLKLDYSNKWQGGVIRIYENSNEIYSFTVSGTNQSLELNERSTSPGFEYRATLTYGGSTATLIQMTRVTSTGIGNFTSPLVLDLNGDGVQTTDLQEESVRFDVSNSGVLLETAWVSKHDGLLALDLNGDGLINNGSELFGNSTVLLGDEGLLAADGWSALAQYDSNADGRIDAQDEIYAALLVWQDANGDGISDADELRTLAEQAIASINLKHDGQKLDQNGNVLEGFSTFTKTDGTTLEVVDAWFQTRVAPTTAPVESAESAEQAAESEQVLGEEESTPESPAPVIPPAQPLLSDLQMLMIQSS